MEEPSGAPGGWPAFVAPRAEGSEFPMPPRGGLYDDVGLIGDLAGATATSIPSLGGMTMKKKEDGPWQQQDAPGGLKRPETPILAYVDRASMPGFVDTKEPETETRTQQVGRDREVKEASSWAAQPADPSAGLDEWERELAEFQRKYGCSESMIANAAPVSPQQQFSEQVIPSESMLNTDIDLAEMRQGNQADALDRTRQVSPPQTTTTILQSALDTAGRSLRNEADELDQARRQGQDRQASPTALSRAEEQGQTLRQELGTLRGDTLPFAVSASTQLALVPKPPSISPPPDGYRRPEKEYTEQDVELATETAKTRVQADGSWNSEYSEVGLQKRDFLMDLRKQREKHKGRQAQGPLWAHLAKQAKNLANTFDLQDLLEVLKLFASVRLDDYELYMRVLGEVPHYVTQATASQLCELVRILARRRLRERNYVDMVAAHLLQKIRATDDTLPARQLVKVANAFASLECRSNPKFVEHFLRHMEHRMHELDAALCCIVAPIFVDQYMNDALRRAYLCRCAETHAGFQCPLEEARNIACTELILRKEHHSLVVSLPPHVMRYLDKVQRHAQFDKWGAVTMPASVAPDGPKGNERAEMSLSLQLKASTANGAGKQADVFSSEMHRDVSACLSHLGVDHENGSLAGPYLLDIVAQDMVNPSKRIIFEVNSPHHYYEGTKQLVAEKRLRHRMIGRMGHKLHMVNAEEWKKLSAAQKMTFMLKLQQEQQEENVREEKQKAAANTTRAPLPALPMGNHSAGSDPLRLKSIGDLRQPIRVPVPPSQRARQPLSAR